MNDPIYPSSISCYFDESGDQKPLLVLALILLEPPEIQSIRAHLLKLKSSLQDNNNSIWSKNTEFHANEIFNKRGIYRSLKDEELSKIRDAFEQLICELSYGAVLIDKTKGATRDLEAFDNEIDLYLKELKLKNPQKYDKIDTYLKATTDKEGMGLIGPCFFMLFGLSAGLFEWNRLKLRNKKCIDKIHYYSQAKVFPDINFIKRPKTFDTCLRLTKFLWPEIKKNLTFSLWPNNFKPDWNIEDSFQAQDSCNSDALQVVDFLAYAIKKRYEIENPQSITSSSKYFQNLRIFSPQDLKSLPIAIQNEYTETSGVFLFMKTKYKEQIKHSFTKKRH